MAIAPPARAEQACDDQIGLFEFWGILWAKKLLVLGSAALFGLGGFLFATLQLGNSDQHVYTAFVEIGRYVTQIGEIHTLESPHDLVLILNQQTGGAKASVPRGSVSVISLEANHTEPAIAKQKLDSSLVFIRNRHEALVSHLPGKLLTHSGSVAEPTVTVKNMKNKRMQVVFVSSIGGLLLGILGAMMINWMQQCRTRKAIG